MSDSLATLNDQRVTACRLHVPAWGIPWADVECAADETLTGAVTLTIADVGFRCTIMSGGPYQTRQRYRIAGGAGGWGKRIAAKGYANDLGVKAATVLRDAAAACGETLGAPPLSVGGPSYVRPEGPASRALEYLFPRGWYVDENGLTQVGRRVAVPYTGTATALVNDGGHNRIEFAPDSIVGLLPGAIFDGLEAVDVEHAIDDGKLRSTVWGRGIADTSRFSVAMGRIVEALTARSRYFAPWEYRVVQRNGERLDLQVVRVSTGMPDLRNVRVRPGVAGMRSHPKLGSIVEVAFLNGDPSRPVVVGFDDQDGAGIVADEIAALAGATANDTEHATSAEALVNFVRQALLQLATPLGGSGAVDAAILAALPLAASSSISTFSTAINAALAAKSKDTDGKTPGLGWPSVKGG